MVGGITGGDPSGIDGIGAAASGKGSLEGGGGSFRGVLGDKGGLRPLFACGPDADSKCGEAFG